jgi:hypothetical protein
MKHLIYLTFSILFIARFAFSANMGGKGGDGGNTVGSSTEEILNLISFEYQSSGDVGKYSFFGFNNILSLLNKRISNGSFFQFKNKKIIEMLNKINSEGLMDYTSRPYILRPNEEIDSKYKNYPVIIRLQLSKCLDSSEVRDASVVIKNTTYKGKKIKQANICLSIDGLKKYSIADLEIQASSLLIHEYAHVAGYGESDATFLQDFLVNYAFQKCSILVYGENTNDPTKSHKFTIDITSLDEIGFNLFKINESDKIIIEHTANGSCFSNNDIKENQTGYNLCGTNKTSLISFDKDRYSTENKQFQLRFNEHGGEIIFKSYELNDTIATQKLSWGKMFQSSNLGNKGNLRSNEILSHEISFNGQSIRPKGIGIYGGCTY